jgi:hypothetical protein
LVLRRVSLRAFRISSSSISILVRLMGTIIHHFIRNWCIENLAAPSERPSFFRRLGQLPRLIRVGVRGQVRGTSGMSSETRALVPTVASSVPESLGEAGVCVCVPPWLGRNIDRASSAPDASLLDPPGCEGRCWPRRASGIGRSAWRVTGRRFHGAFWLHILEPCSGPLADSRF